MGTQPFLCVVEGDYEKITEVWSIQIRLGTLLKVFYKAKGCQIIGTRMRPRISEKPCYIKFCLDEKDETSSISINSKIIDVCPENSPTNGFR